MDSEQNNEPISEPLKTSREKNSTPSSDNPSLVRYRNLRYNILKSLNDKAVRDIDFPELEPCSEYSPLSQSSRTSALTNTMSERFILTSPPMRMEGVENIGTQQMGSQLRCVKCSEDLSSTTDTSSKKRSNEGTDSNSSTLKKKAKKPVSREDSPILKKLIKELSAPIPQQRSSSGTISLQTFPEMTDIKSVNFRELNDRIVEVEDDNQKAILVVIRSYYFFGKEYMLWFNHYKKTYSEDTSNFLVNDKIRECFPNQNKTSEANLRKRKERAIKIFKLFDGVEGEEKILLSLFLCQLFQGWEWMTLIM
ncbi:hypothetical protein RhiirA4_546031 [Rhizophagus irregularis]|uniref:Uncharacterized protein n=1 Tax=Rhizophagus irregularis TaxID=588596 RepID=A0A2I1GV90_9GLOM|nr:hypothetical protein RhiirA4_546031 [Rhizophagus irregularis]